MYKLCKYEYELPLYFENNVEINMSVLSFKLIQSFAFYPENGNENTFEKFNNIWLGVVLNWLVLFGFLH